MAINIDEKKIVQLISKIVDDKLKEFADKNLSFRTWNKMDSVTDQFSPITGASQMIGFYGTPKVSKQTVTGSRGGNAALASLLTKLATLGLLTDSSS